MKRVIIILFVSLILSNLFSEEIVTLNDGRKIIVYDDHTWIEYSDNNLSIEDIVNKNKQYLRSDISASQDEVSVACEMYEQGWTYTMPRPKSAKAAWGVSDGRTTWYNGWWYNSKTNLYSDSTPEKSSSGLFLGDGQNSSHTWRNGGAPRRPDIFMFLLSSSGGPRF